MARTSIPMSWRHAYRNHNFARVSSRGERTNCGRLELGDQTVVIERRPKFILAVAITGKPRPRSRRRCGFSSNARSDATADDGSVDRRSARVPRLQAMTSRLFL